VRTPVRVHSQLAPKLLQVAYRSLRENPPDVIHAYGTSFTALVAAGVSRLLKRPLVTTLPDDEKPSLPLARRIPGFAYEHSLGRAIISTSDRVIACPLSMRETLDVYVDALAERELRWFLQHQAA
jgi:hypothetical protein